MDSASEALGWRDPPFVRLDPVYDGHRVAPLGVIVLTLFGALLILAAVLLAVVAIASGAIVISAVSGVLWGGAALVADELYHRRGPHLHGPRRG